MSRIAYQLQLCNDIEYESEVLAVSAEGLPYIIGTHLDTFKYFVFQYINGRATSDLSQPSGEKSLSYSSFAPAGLHNHLWKIK